MKQRRGFTLVELSLALAVGLILSSLVLALANQQFAFLRIFNTQRFLVEEAPMIGLYVGRIAGKADGFRLHASVDDALSQRDARLEDSPVMLMNFRQPDGTERKALLAFETRDDRSQLNYYMVPESPSPLLGEPQWSVSKNVAGVSFSIERGVLRMELTGPAGEKITYSGTMQQ